MNYFTGYIIKTKYNGHFEYIFMERDELNSTNYLNLGKKTDMLSKQKVRVMYFFTIVSSFRVIWYQSRCSRRIDR